MKKIYLAIFIVTSVAVFGSAFFIFSSKKDANQEFKAKNEKAKTESGVAGKNQGNSEGQGENGEGDESNSQNENPAETQNWDGFNPPTVSSADCDKNCQKFTDQREKIYCQKVCGLPLDDPDEEVDYPEDSEDDEFSDINENESENQADCEKLVKIDRDACLKDKAIKDRDFNICDQISDSQIRKTCKNRITEDILNSQ